MKFKNYRSSLLLFKKAFIALILGFFSLQFVQAQEGKIQLVCQIPSLNEKVLKKLKYVKIHSDSLSVMKEIGQVVTSLQKQAYLSANLDSIVYKKAVFIAYISSGKKYLWKELKTGNLSDALAGQIGFKEKYYQNRPLSYKDWESLKNKILRYSENQGYPFASVRLDSLEFTDEGMKASMDYKQGPLIRFDSMQIDGSVRIKQQFLIRYLKIKPGQTFSQEKVETTERLLKQLPYVKVRKPPVVDFKEDLAYVKLFADKKQANQIDGILGILPNEERVGGVLVTGELNLDLRNLFYSGKNFHAKWQRLQSAAQLLDLEYENPAFLGTNLDYKFNFYLLRQDSSFVNNNLGLTLYYNMPNTAKLSLGINRKQSNLGDANFFTQAAELPDISEIRYLSFGLGYNWNNLDNFFYPRKGNRLVFDISLGNKEIFKNPFLEDSLYNGLLLKTTQAVLTGDFQHFFRIRRKATLMTRLNTGAIFNSQLFVNDLFRLGGLNNLRGHNQNVFFASSYAIGTLEYRFFIEEESYLFLFYDQAFIQRKLIKNFNEDFPLGMGVGISFAVKGGVFNFVYALGQSQEQTLGFNRSKIHFGFVSRF